jgi:isopentenyl diphosphate isomerase/L-lactate dehydrogenase-like FMN-dependent dehydrogenase
LERALKALAHRSAVPVELDLRVERRPPEHVEVAAYYAVAEALTNAAKYARASVVHVELDEDVAARFGATPGLFQLYTPRDRDLAASFVQRAERAGFKAIVVTLDTWMTGWRPRDLNGASFPQLRGYCLENYFSDEAFLRRLSASPEADLKAATREWIDIWDVAKALAMGAAAVGVGRPYAYALAVGGTDGVVHQLKAILAELDLLMAIDGYPTIAALREAGVRKA